MFVVVSYDMPEDKRRIKVMRALKNYGAHVQYSVFECALKEAAYKKMRARLADLISPRHDSVRPVERAKAFYVVG